MVSYVGVYGCGCISVNSLMNAVVSTNVMLLNHYFANCKSYEYSLSPSYRSWPGRNVSSY